MTPDVCLVVHPIDHDAHPDIPEGFRYAVMIGGAPPAAIEACAIAGWGPTRKQATIDGDACAAGVVRALRMFGIPAVFRRHNLDQDPIPPEESRIAVLNEG